MPSQYVPTGKPRGRPKAPPAEHPPPRDVPTLFKDTTVDRRHRPMETICGQCFPGGWDEAIPHGQITASVACEHGTWVKR